MQPKSKGTYLKLQNVNSKKSNSHFQAFLLFIFGLFFSFKTIAQENKYSLLKEKKVAVKDTIFIDSTSIQKEQFKLLSLSGEKIDSSYYKVDFAKSKLYLNTKKINTDSLQITYLRYPFFLTKTYTELSTQLIVPENKGIQRFYKLNNPKTYNENKFFDGLSTSGSISRGITVGNNQNSIFNSELDLQLSGKLSNDVTIRASLQDSNIPIQQGGYSQSIDEFDQIFIEIQSKKWSARAGDIQVSEKESIFSTFTKKLQGLTLNATFGNTEVFTSGAIVRGVFNQSNFNGQEGNQGPYKLVGQNGELFVLIVSGSETVFVNGLPLKRGENNDYVIDYNAGEIRFNPTFPITADMRIAVQYQTTQSNFARIFGMGGASYTSDKLKIKGFIYNENDLRNQTLQQNLSDQQKQVLANAGDNTDLMIAPSAVQDTFSENKTLYKNIGTEANPIYQFTNAEEDQNLPLFNVRFTEVGQGLGNYILVNNNATTRIFEYIAPINGNLQGSFEPITQLAAPNKLQLAMVMGSYSPSKKTQINFEFAGSNNDNNLFSKIDDTNNQGTAIHTDVSQQLFKFGNSKWLVRLNSGIDYINSKYRNIENLYNIEFSRDWNLEPNGNRNNQILTINKLRFSNTNNNYFEYGFQYLDFEKQYKGLRQLWNGILNNKNWEWRQNSSWLVSDATLEKSNFLRNSTTVNYKYKKLWSGTQFLAEANEQKTKESDAFTPLSQRFQSYEVYTGIGDSTKVFTKIGYRYRVNDSIQNQKLQKVATSNTAYLNSRIFNNTKTQLSFFINYRELKDLRETEIDKNLNSRISYRQKIWKNRLQWNTLIETQSGTLPQQEFTYVEVDPGLGQYTWNDYNDDGIQDLQEFEISVFADQANYIRVLLPRQKFIKTYKNKLSQQLNINFSSFKNSDNNWENLLSKFYNQSSYIIDRSVLREGNQLKLNVFENSKDDLGLNLNFRNSLFFNRGKQRYSTTYTFLNTRAKNVLVTGNQENDFLSNRLNFSHKIEESWLFDLQIENNTNSSKVENTPNRNYKLLLNSIFPKVSYLLSNQSNISLSYQWTSKENSRGIEALNQQKLTSSFRFSDKQNTTFTGDFNWFENEFTGDAFSPVAFQILEGLEPGRNFTWNAIAQKKLTKFLELNLNYNGRKSESSKAIHTGSVQLRAFF